MTKQRLTSSSWHQARASIGEQMRTVLVEMEQRWPRGYLAATAALGGLGYAYLWLFPVLLYISLTKLPEMVTTSNTMGDWAQVLGLTFVGAAGAMMTYSLMRFRPPQPQGIELPREQTPRLIKLTDELSALHLSAKIHRVCLTDRYSVEVIRTPRRGLPLAQENSLMIGLLVMQTLTPTQFKALLAREVGRLSGRHDRLLGWLYHLRASWAQFADFDAVQPAPCRWVLRAFFAWYTPLYRLVAEIAARHCEEASDGYALDIVHHENVADMLVAMAVNAGFIEDKFWPTIHRMRGKASEPSHLPFTSMVRAFSRGVREPERKVWFERALSAQGERRANGPTLKERLEQIGASTAKLPPPPHETAAERYLGNARAYLEEEMDKQWLAVNLPLWTRAYRKRQKALQHVELLRGKADAGALRGEEVREYIRLVGKYVHRTEAYAYLKNLLDARPEDAKLHFDVGRMLVSWCDPRGVSALEQAMSLNDGYADRACRLISRLQGGNPQPRSKVVTLVPVESAAVRGAA